MRLFLSLFLIISSIFVGASVQFHPIPYEDAEQGRNSHVYLPRIDTITYEERAWFIQEIAEYAQQAQKNWGVPASALIGMAALESGYGTTKIAYYANNLFGVKVWGTSPDQAWQLVGQPDEDFEQPIPIIANYGPDRIIYDESKRRDNWYRKFASYKESLDYVAGRLLQNQRYAFAKDRYEKHLLDGWSLSEASKQYLYDIAEAGYNHQGGTYYKDTVGKIIDYWDLTQYDLTHVIHNRSQEIVFKDLSGHWAEEAVMQLVERELIRGYPDGTFRPNETIKREHLLRLLNELRLDLGKSLLDFDRILDFNENEKVEDAVNRAKMARLLAITLDLPPDYTPLPFQDIAHIEDQDGNIGAVVQRQLIIGYEDGTFRPHERVTRAQVAMILFRLLFSK